jgi:hypothetical protein
MARPLGSKPCLICGRVFQQPKTFYERRWDNQKTCNRKCGKELRDRRAGNNLKKLFYQRAMLPTDGESCWLWAGTTRRAGYGFIKYKRKKYAAHHVSYRIYHGPIPDGLIVRHSCDVPGCVSPHHLIAGTHKENSADIWIRGRARVPKGEQNGASKLTADDVRTIRHSKKRTAELAKEFGVKPNAINDIKIGKTWKHI